MHARDLKILCEKDYELVKVRAVDQFCHSVHVESIVLLSHKSPDIHIDVKVEFGEGKGGNAFGCNCREGKEIPAETENYI